MTEIHEARWDPVLGALDAFLRWPGWDEATAAACVVGLALCAWFVGRYHWMSGGGWRDYPEGRFFMQRKALLGALFGSVLARHFSPAWPGWQPVFFALLTLYAVQTYQPYRLLLLAHRDHDHRTDGREQRVSR